MLTAVLCLGIGTAAAGPGKARSTNFALKARQLEKARSYKVRLSAALQLRKSRSPIAVRALTRALANDPKATIRSVAALSLPGVIGASTSKQLRTRVVAGLKRGARSDKSSRVRKACKKALAKLTGSASKLRRGQIVLHVGVPFDHTRRMSSKNRAQIQKSVLTAFRKLRPRYRASTQISTLPTVAEMTERGARGFFVGPSVSKLNVRRRGSLAEVKCEVGVRVSPWSGRGGHERMVAGQTASVRGAAKVTGPGTRASVARLQRNCVVAVVEQLVRRKVVRFIDRAARKQLADSR